MANALSLPAVKSMLVHQVHYSLRCQEKCQGHGLWAWAMGMRLQGHPNCHTQWYSRCNVALKVSKWLRNIFKRFVFTLSADQTEEYVWSGQCGTERERERERKRERVSAKHSIVAARDVCVTDGNESEWNCSMNNCLVIHNKMLIHSGVLVPQLNVNGSVS